MSPKPPQRLALALLALSTFLLVGAAAVQVYQSPIVVPTLADMQRLEPHARMGTVRVLGRERPGDWGEPRDFTPAQTNLLVTNVVQQVSEIKTNWAFLHKWDGDVRVFGAKGDGTADDSDALNEAFAATPTSKDRRIIIPKTEHFFKISKQLVFTNSNATIDWLGKVRCADGVSYHILMFGTNPTFDADGRPMPVHSNLVVNGYGVGELDGNSHNAREYFPVSAAAVYGGHGFNFVGYDNVQLNGMVVRDVPNWAVNFQRCVRFKALDNTVLTGMGNNSTNWNGKNQDGIHMVDSWDGVVSGNWVRSSDDNYAITTYVGNVRNIVISDNIGEHNFLESDSHQAGGKYYAIGRNVIVTNDQPASTNYVENILIANNLFYGGNGGFSMQNSGVFSNQVRRVRIQGNHFHNKTALGGNGYLGVHIGFLSRVYDISVVGNSFAGLARTLYIQDGSLIDVSGNTWDGDVINTNIAAAIIIDGVSSTLPDNRKFTINNNRFNGTYRSAVRGSAFNVSGARVFHDIEVRGNQFLNGPQDTSRFAVQLTGFGGRVVVDENVFQNWVGGGVMVLNPESHVSLSGNSWIDCTDATLPMAQILTTNGMLIPYVAVRDNVVFRHGAGFDIRNVEVLDVEGNSVVSAQQQAPSSSYFSLTWTGDGSGTNPVTTGIRGRFQNNFVSRTNTAGSAVAVTYNSMPDYAGSAFYVRGNRVVGMTTPFSTANTSLFPDYEMLDQRPMFGAFVPTFGSYFRYLDQASTNGGTAFSVDRTITVNGSLSSDVAAFSAINRLGGSGTNSTQVRAGTFTSSQDRTNDVSEIRALEAQARLTSSGGASVARAIVGQLVGQSNGVITLGASFTAPSPALSGGATVGSAIGLAIEQQAVSGVTNGFAIRQAGTNDINAFMSPLYLGALGTNTPLVFGGTAAPTLSAANGSLYLRTDGTIFRMQGGSWVALETGFDARISDAAYDATAWNGDTNAPTKNAVRDAIEALGGGGGGTGSVTSVSLALPSNLFHVSGNPVTNTGTLTGTLTNQSANRVFAGPTSGGDATPAFRLLVLDDIPSGVATDAELNARISDAAYDATAWNGDTNAPTKNAVRDVIETIVGGGGTGSVTSVALSLPSALFQVSGSPVTTVGTLTGTLTNQSANRVFAGPTSGGDATPAFRLLVLDDIPSGVATDAEVNARISDAAYDATAWNGDTNAPTKNAVRDAIEALGGGGGGGTNILVNSNLVANANLVDGPNIKFQVDGSTITPILTNAPGTVTSNVIQRTGMVTFDIADTGMAYEITNVVYEGCVTNLNMVGGYSDATGYFQVLLAARSNATYQVVIEVPGNSYPMSGTGGYLGIVVDETRTTTGFEFIAFGTDGVLSCPVGIGGRIFIYETVTVGGSGDGGGGGGEGAEVSDGWDEWDEWLVTDWHFVGNAGSSTLEPNLVFAAVSGGVNTSPTRPTGSTGIRTASGAAVNTGGFIHSGSGSMYMLSNTVWQWRVIGSVLQTNGNLARLGFSDSTTTVEPVDALMFAVTNQVAWPVALSNSVKSVGSSGFTLQQGVVYGFDIRQTNDFAAFQIYSNIIGAPSVLLYSNSISGGLPLGSSRALGLLIGGYNGDTSNTNSTDILNFERMRLRQRN